MQMNGFLENPADGTICPLVSAVFWTPEMVEIVVVPVTIVAGGSFSECWSIAL